MAGTNQITWENKVNTKTLDIPRINKIIDDDLNEIKTKFNALDTIVTDPVTGLEVVKLDEPQVLALFPVKSSQFEVVESEARIVQLGFNPSGSVVNFQTPEEEFGSLAEPLTDITFSFANAKRNRVFAYVQSATVLSRIVEADNTDIKFIGDAFNTTSGFVNILKIRYQPAPAPQNRWVLIENKAIELVSPFDETLVLFFEYEETEGNETDANDSSGYGNNGVYSTSSVDRGTGVIGQSFTTTGSGASNFFDIPHSASLQLTNFTFMTWYKTTTANLAAVSGIASKDCNESGLLTNGGFFLRKNADGIFEARINMSTGSRVFSTTNYNTADVWVHIAIVYIDSTSLRILINGVQEAIDSTVAAMITNEERLVIGGSRGNAFANAFNVGSEMDNTRLYNVALNNSEILDIYNAEV
jgi:hypothetical protein